MLRRECEARAAAGAQQRCREGAEKAIRREDEAEAGEFGRLIKPGEIEAFVAVTPLLAGVKPDFPEIGQDDPAAAWACRCGIGESLCERVGPAPAQGRIELMAGSLQFDECRHARPGRQRKLTEREVDRADRQPQLRHHARGAARKRRHIAEDLFEDEGIEALFEFWLAQATQQPRAHALCPQAHRPALTPGNAAGLAGGGVAHEAGIEERHGGRQQITHTLSVQYALCI